MYQRRKLYSSLELPANPQDFRGVVFDVLERGQTVDAPSQWTGTAGGWMTLGNVVVSSPSALPAAANCALGARAVVDVAAPGGLTRAPSQGTKMRRLKLAVDYLPDDATKAWRPDGQQTLFNFAGLPGAPAGANFTATGATGIISEIGQFPVGFLSTPGTELYWHLMLGRGATAAGTVTLALTLGPTPGTIGTTLGAIASVAANANAVATLDGSMTVADATHETVSFTLAPNASANVAGSVPIALNLAVAQTLQLSFSSATTSDIFNFICGTVGIR